MEVESDVVTSVVRWDGREAGICCFPVADEVEDQDCMVAFAKGGEKANCVHNRGLIRDHEV